MGSETSSKILPILDFCSDPRVLEQGTEEWKVMSAKVREALEKIGVFQVAYGSPTALPETVREDMFAAMKQLFDLPLETKEKNASTPFGYVKHFGNSKHGEVLGVPNAMELSSTQAFTKLMWENGNDAICQTLNSMCVKLFEVYQIIVKMILDNFGLGTYDNSPFKNNYNVLRMMKYKANNNSDQDVGLGSHTDQGWLTVLCQGKVGGLEVQSKEGDWIQVAPSKDSLVVFAGDSLEAWSNGRFRAAEHRVVMVGGDKDRFSFGFFNGPLGQQTVEVAQELVDEEHPRLFKPFIIGDLINFWASNGYPKDALRMFAGI